MSRPRNHHGTFYAALFACSELIGVFPAAATPGSEVRTMRAAFHLPVVDLAISGDRDDAQRLTPSRQTSSPIARRSPGPDAEEQVGAANEAARVQPVDSGFQNATQRYAYREGALFQVYTKPGQITDITLQAGEKLVGPGPVASGDTVRWIIGDTVSGSGDSARVHILVKPTRPDISTNLVINTDRRTYHVELHAGQRIYMASVSWSYPDDELIALRRAEETSARTAPVAQSPTLEALNFDYRLSGDRPSWRPVRVFDDGRQTLVEFAPQIAEGEMPPLFVLGSSGAAELVNYRVSGRYIVVDRLFEKAELRLGAGRRQLRVRILNQAWSKS